MSSFAPSGLSIYLHIPFCKKKCAYCDFNTYAGAEHLIDDFVDSMVKEIEQVGNTVGGQEAATIFFGGGTPSLISVKNYEKIFEALHRQFIFSKDCEVSLEANPGTISPKYFEGLLNVGFNRISFGVQSSDQYILKFLDRIHNFETVANSFQAARSAGFANINLDLIFGIPGQTKLVWEKTLNDCLQLEPEHFSAYALGIEVGTPLDLWYRKGLIPKIDNDLAADQYELAQEVLSQNGFGQYEISNWAKPNMECHHNLSYWRNENYLGLGPGAHGHYERRRYWNIKSIPEYIKRMNRLADNDLMVPCTNAYDDHHLNSAEEELEDLIMCKLRLIREGLDLQAVNEIYGIDFEQKYSKQLKRLQQKELIEIQNNNLVLSRRGVLLGNQVFLEFVG